MEGGFNRYPKQPKTNSALTIHSGNNPAAAAAAHALPTANVNAPNNVVNHHGKQPLTPPSPKSSVLREQDTYMPIANVIRIMRRILPHHAKISDDAKETVQECVSEFISFVTGEANERCHDEERKTITSEDIIWAMDQLGFDDFVDPITKFKDRYRESESWRLWAQKEPNMKRRGEVADYEPLVMGGAGPLGSIGPAAYNLSPQQVFNDPLLMKHYNFSYNNSDSAGASSSMANLPGFDPYCQYK